MIAANRHQRRREEALSRRQETLQRQGPTYKESSPFHLSDKGGDPLLSSRGTREYCGDISEMTLWRWTRDHSFPPPDTTINRRRFWRRSSLDAWLNMMQGKAA
jgi:predicted DNA-binding transcriptional regulator AlpA